MKLQGTHDAEGNEQSEDSCKTPGSQSSKAELSNASFLQQGLPMAQEQWMRRLWWSKRPRFPGTLGVSLHGSR